MDNDVAWMNVALTKIAWDGHLEIHCLDRLHDQIVAWKMSIGVGRRLVELNKSQDTASRRNNNVECITKSFKNNKLSS